MQMIEGVLISGVLMLIFLSSQTTANDDWFTKNYAFDQIKKAVPKIKN
jgi:hypothetical protein